jgi:hypothetical protein
VSAVGLKPNLLDFIVVREWFGESVPVRSEEWESARSLALSLVQQAGEWVQARALVLDLEQAEELGQVQVLVLDLVSVRDWVRGRGLALD